MNLTTATPVEIDTALADLHYALYRAEDSHEVALDRLHSAAGDERPSRYGHTGSWQMTDDEAFLAAEARSEGTGREAARALDAFNRVVAVRAQMNSIRTDMEPLNAEYDRRGGWTRAYLVVTSGKGHVHTSRRCSTCYVTTRYSWQVEFSGADEAEIVDAAGERACTVCYPTAPVAVLAKPTRMFSAEERVAQVARDARAEAKAKREAAKIAKALTADGSEFRIKSNGYTERFKTAQSAIQWLVGQEVYVTWGYERGADFAEARAAIRDAYVAKFGGTADEFDTMVAAKVAAKIKRDAR